MEDFANVLAFEIKEDLAKRYFGSRKKIENSSALYSESLLHTSEKGNLNVIACIDQIYFLLANDKLCSDFFKLTGLPQDYSPPLGSIVHTSLSNQFPANIKLKGFTRRQRYRNALRFLYTQLEEEVSNYLEEYQELQDFHEDIRKEIKQFYRNFDLTTILQFLREIDNPDQGRDAVFDSQLTTPNRHNLDATLKIKYPEPPETLLVPIKPILSLQKVTNNLNTFSQQGYSFFVSQHNSRLLR